MSNLGLSAAGLVKKAETYARLAHKGQKRKYNGSPYYLHPERVARRVSKYTNDQNVIAAAYLHDVIEDCEISQDELDNEFGGKVADLVYFLTNPSRYYPELKRAYRKEMDRNHLKNAPAEAQLIKVVDRIDNLDEMSEAKDGFKVLYAKESILLADVLTKAPEELRLELYEKANRIINL